MRPDDAHGFEDARAALAAWRDGIAEPGAASRLADLPRGGADLIEITAPEPEKILATLRSGQDCAFQEGGPGTVLGVDLPPDTLHPLLRHLRRHAHRESADRGADVLHLATGLLHWQDEDGTGHAAPIHLTPVELIALGPGEVPRLRATHGDPVLNPALAARLHGLGLELTADRAELRRRIGGRSGWRVTDTVVLARFDLGAETIRRDLADHEEQILAHPVVQALAAADGTDGAFTFDPVPPDRVGEDQPLVLDADATQRVCVDAALNGHSFVIDGPPGTGKSQTVANMIGALAYAGKRVLFVSETAAALDTVQHRLAAAGLGNYLLDLHGPRAGRRQVASALAAALEAVPLPPQGLDETDRDRLRADRAALGAYAEAVNEIREPYGRSLHEILGRCARLTGEDEKAVREESALERNLQTQALTDEALDRIHQAAERLKAAWRPATERSGYRWREVMEKRPLDGALEAAQLALDALADALTPHAALAGAFHLRLPVDADALAQIAAHAGKRPAGVPDHWLTSPALRPVREAADALAERIDEVRRAEDLARERLGIPAGVLAELEVADLPETPELDPPAVGLGTLTAAAARTLAGRFTADADELEHQQQNLDRITHRLGLPDVITFSDVELVTVVAELGARPDKPETAWFAPGAQAAVHGASAALRRHVEAVSTAKHQARRYFREAVLGEPVEDLAERFATVHRGVRRFLAAHRWDKETVAALAEPGVTVEEAVANLGLAVAWRRSYEGLVAAEKQNAALLGRYWKRLDTDFVAIGRALHTVDEVLKVTPPEALGAVVEYVANRAGNGEVLHAVTEARDVFRHWRSTLRPEPEPAARTELGHGSVQHAVGWLRAQVGPLRAVAEAVERLDGLTGRELDVTEASGMVAVRRKIVEAAEALAADGPAHAAALGERYRGRETDLNGLVAAIEWAAQARALRTGSESAFTADQAQAVLTGDARGAGDLPGLIGVWQAARQRIIDAFGPARQVRLGTALDRYETARDLLQDLRDDDTGQREWFDYLAAREVLAGYGVDGAVDYCADHNLDPAQLAGVIERTVFRAWADEIIAADERLIPLAAAERNEIVEEFRRLDADLLEDAAGRIIEAVDARRPSAGAKGGPAVIRSEGQKQHGHQPVRALLEKAWDAAIALKPCFAMPPAAVSAYLPAGRTFDVVIIDEASRMTPAAAVACAYRGESLIVIGDDCQLPPAGGQPSVLVAANDCGAFTRLALTRHYRSRHESLIGFANRAFYRDRLVTYPSAHSTGTDLGIEVFPASGPTGSGPDEAALVAERVAHHVSTRPTLSLGVVTLTAGQADAVADAVETALAARPDLERFLGGFFVKSADTVQGEERDVIILATGADLAAAGGPTGARRLTVAITRARQRVEVVTAIPAGGREEPADEGERRLAEYLDHAGQSIPAAEAPPLTELAEAVLQTVAGWGYDVHSRVGAGLGRLELAVRHSAVEAGAFALGIQCDGPAYRGIPSVRDRDRLHDQVLHGLGWHLHRIWSVAWFTDRAAEEARLRAAIQNALAVPDVFAEVDRELATRPAQRPEWALPYERAAIDPLTAAARANDTAARAQLVAAVERIAEVEGPVHLTVLTQRVREAWHIARVTSAIRGAIDHAIASSRVGFDGSFVTWPEALIPAVRVPGDGVTRKPEQVAEPELQSALEYLVLDAGLVEADDLIAAAGRLFGWSGAKSGAAGRLAAMLDDLVTGERLIAHPNGLIAAPADDLFDLPDPATLPHREDAVPHPEDSITEPAPSQAG
ncbi:DUF3320 domain-containing protein [Actinoplanes sp. NPDC051851]|uniref:DUF3320 domain-containing protein n=1 Tax=Actinoplanes sp. NPDC051851 TaxID=3154753 RepID=UPI003417F419